MVNGLARGVLERQVSGLARAQPAAQQGFHQRAQALARHPNDAHRPAPGRSGNGNDGVVLAGQQIRT